MKTKNVLRELIRSGQPTIGTHVHVVWGGMAEVIGHSGTIDYVEFAGQYAPFDLFALENFARAVDLHDHMSSMMKLNQQPRTFLAERAISSGIQNLLFADIRTVEDAREAVASMRPETPEAGGVKGITDSRDAGYVFPGRSPAEHVKMMEEGVVALMIEKKQAVEDLEKILAVPGVDMVQFGPSDHSMSIGIPGKEDDPAVKEAERYTIEAAIKMGIRPRVEIERAEEAEPYIEMGVRDFCIGWDLRTVYNHCREQGGALAQTLGR